VQVGSGVLGHKLHLQRRFAGLLLTPLYYMLHCRAAGGSWYCSRSAVSIPDQTQGPDRGCKRRRSQSWCSEKCGMRHGSTHNTTLLHSL
jgi:hypothetical protein